MPISPRKPSQPPHPRSSAGACRARIHHGPRRCLQPRRACVTDGPQRPSIERCSFAWVTLLHRAKSCTPLGHTCSWHMPESDRCKLAAGLRRQWCDCQVVGVGDGHASALVSSPRKVKHRELRAKGIPVEAPLPKRGGEGDGWILACGVTVGMVARMRRGSEARERLATWGARAVEGDWSNDGDALPARVAPDRGDTVLHTQTTPRCRGRGGYNPAVTLGAMRARRRTRGTVCRHLLHQLRQHRHSWCICRRRARLTRPTPFGAGRVIRERRGDNPESM